MSMTQLVMNAELVEGGGPHEFESHRTHSWGGEET